MPQFPPGGNFEPSRETRWLWRFTRKSGASYSGVALPGLFQTSHIVSDSVLFLSVILLEMWGLANLLIVGGANPIYVVVLFLLDITLAVIRHLPAGGICENRNRLVFEIDEVEVARLRNKIRGGEFFSGFIALLITLVAVVKIVSFWGLQGEFNGLTAGITVSYLVAALIHVHVTGYFLFSLFTEARCWLDRRKWVNAPPSDRPYLIGDYRQHVFTSPGPVDEWQVDKHTIEKYPTPSGDRYVLKTWGVLMDSQLQEFINRQADQNVKAAVAKEGVEHQVIDILQAGKA